MKAEPYLRGIRDWCQSDGPIPGLAGGLLGAALFVYATSGLTTTEVVVTLAVTSFFVFAAGGVVYSALDVYLKRGER